MFLQRNTCCLSLMETNIMPNMFHNHKTDYTAYIGHLSYQRVHQKGIDKQVETEVALFMSTPVSHIWA